jgi:hypothetical protein
MIFVHVPWTTGVDQKNVLHASHLQNQKTRARVSKWINTRVCTKRVKLVSSHLLKRGVSKIHPITSHTWNSLMFHRESLSHFIRGVRAPRGGNIVRSSFETQSCDHFSQTCIDHEKKNVQQTLHTLTQNTDHYLFEKQNHDYEILVYHE